MNTYLFGSLVLVGFWGLTYLYLHLRAREPSQLREFWWASWFCCLLGATEFLFVPEYWTPPSVTPWLYPWDLESFIFCFATGGIASVLTEHARLKRLFLNIDYGIWRVLVMAAGWLRPRVSGSSQERRAVPILARSAVVLPHRRNSENALLLVFFMAVFGATAQLGINILYDSAIVCLATGLFIAWRRTRLRWQVIGGAVTFTVVYAITLMIVDLYDPHFYENHWAPEIVAGMKILNAPVEEYLFAATFGAFWAPLYEAWREARAEDTPWRAPRTS